ncbi:MAG: M23 family metallopeptidase [Longimicrobiales bacterium]|nr:M23 family metallopeptidase [Longimicrobiales bacterium]
MKSSDWTRTTRRAALTVSAMALSACVTEVPDAGRLDPVYATPAEHVEIVSLGRGQTFGELLHGAIDATEQASLLLAFQEHASPRRMRQGTEITLRYRQEDDWLRRVDVAISPDETVRLDRSPLGWQSDLIETPVYVDTLFASGEIETVLWSAVVENPVLSDLTYEDRNLLIDHLDRVFQWQVDFSRQIRVGDTYRFVFEREVRPDGSMRAGRLLAAEFVNSGTSYHAVYFDPNGDGRGSYFDLEGQSVRRAFLLKPLSYRRISSRFTNARFHPILKRWRSHRGVDYAADAGTPVMATSDGVVIHRGPKGGLGNAVEIRHPNGFVTRYGHLTGFRGGISVGSRVKQSDVIGYVGMTGLATGPHLHYEMLRSGRHMDPLSVDLPAGDPVPSEDRVRWSSERTARMALLDLIPPAGPVRSFVAEASSPVEVEDVQQTAGGDQR